MSASQENEYFSDGMTEEIINALAKIQELKVTSRTSSFFFKGKNLPIIQIGQELNVSTILEGSIRLGGNQVRITAQLIDVEDDFHFWSETFDRSMEDIFAVQDEISVLIADKLREHIGHFDLGDHLVEAPGIPVEVYKRYLEGRYHLMKLTLPESEKGIEIMKEVVELAPDFAPAYLGINQAYAYLGTMGMISAMEGFTKAQPYLTKAIELDENLPESQLNLAWIACWQNWDFKSAYQHVHNALEIQPSDTHYLTMSNMLAVEGKFTAALTYVDKALDLDPFAPMNVHFKGFIYYMLERYEEAKPFFEKALELKPELPFPPQCLGAQLILSGKASEALNYYTNLPEDQPGSLTKLGGLTMAHALLGHTEEMTNGIQRLEAALQSAEMGTAMNYLIYVHAQLGNTEIALTFIEQGIQYRLPMMLLLPTEPLVKSLRTHPRFKEMLDPLFGRDTTVEVTPRKYKKSLLSKELLEKYTTILEGLMTHEQPYLDPTLTLRSLADKMTIPSNHLSQLLNEGFGKNFAEYVNTYRLETFKAKAADPTQQHLTLLALAYDSGFNSKTVFNTFFKKVMGKTPKAYWKEVSA